MWYKIGHIRSMDCDVAERSNLVGTTRNKAIPVSKESKSVCVMQSLQCISGCISGSLDLQSISGASWQAGSDWEGVRRKTFDFYLPSTLLGFCLLKAHIYF